MDAQEEAGIRVVDSITSLFLCVHKFKEVRVWKYDRTRQDNTTQDKTRQDKTRQDKIRQDKTRQDKMRRV